MPFALDEHTLRQAEDASIKFVNGPWAPIAWMPSNGTGLAGDRLAELAAQECESEVLSSIAEAAATAVPADTAAATSAAAASAASPAGAAQTAVQQQQPSAAAGGASPAGSGGSGSPGSAGKEQPAATTPRGGAGGAGSRQAPAAAATPSPTPSSPASPSPATSSTAKGPAEKPVPAVPSFAARKTWANVVNKEDHEAALAAITRSSASREEVCKDRRKDSIVDFLTHLANQQASDEPIEMPEELKRYGHAMESGINNASKAKYVRRGMRNDPSTNNCYVNVVVQSLLPCSALMQLLSHCSQNDPDRPFYNGMVRLCREFHGRKDSHANDACNVLAMPQVMEIISRWRAIGAQQDAGEFLFYMLNGMHEECKWTARSPTVQPALSNADSRGDDEAEPKQQDEVRSAGVAEDSPVVRIFGGLIRSSLRSKNAKADSVSLEPFNHLILDISSPGVDSVWSALAAYCVTEDVNEGQATKRLQFQLCPKVLILNLKRFSYNKDTNRVQKIMKAVKYEENLVFDKEWLVEGVESPKYQLCSVICHHGDSVNGGHYNAACRYNSEWYMFDDSLVREMQLREVMSQQFTAYLLVYLCNEKVDIRP